jgi:RNA polymerase sigma-70 factor (ECF subfamily)
MLAAAIRRLELDRRAVIVLRYGLEMTPPEIAVTLDIPVGTVHSRLARGLEDLRTQLEAHVG